MPLSFWFGADFRDTGWTFEVFARVVGLGGVSRGVAGAGVSSVMALVSNAKKLAACKISFSGLHGQFFALHLQH